MAEKYPKPNDYSPEPAFPEGHRWEGKPRCKAWNPNQGRQCGKIPLKGYSTCRNHGAKGGRPPTNGKYTYPKVLANHVARVLGDEALLDLNEEIAINSSRIQGLLQMVAHLSEEPGRKQLQSVVDEIEELLKEGSFQEALELLDRIRELINRRPDQAKVWAQIREHLEIARRLTSVQHKHRLDNEQYMPVEVVLELVKLQTRVAMKYMATASDRSEFAKEMRALLPRVD